MFDTVLTVTQLESGSGAMTLHEVDMSQILTDAADLYAGIAEERNLRFDLRIDAGLYARGSAELLFRSACNLLDRSEEHTSELQSLMRISYAVFCLKKKQTSKQTDNTQHA